MLAQDIISVYDESVTDPASGEDVYSAISGKIAAFKADYAAWTAGDGAADVERLGTDLSVIRSTLVEAQHARYAAGDMEGFRALGATIADVDATMQHQSELAAEVSRWSGTWDTLAGWLAALASAFGLGFIIPLGLTVAVAVAAIGALAWVVTTWQTTRAKTALFQDLADRMTRGELSPEQVKTLTDNAAGGWFTGLGTAGVLVLGGVALLLFVRR